MKQIASAWVSAACAAMIGCGGGAPGPNEQSGTIGVRSPGSYAGSGLTPNEIRKQQQLASERAALRGLAIGLLVDACSDRDAQTRANAYEALTLAPAYLTESVGKGLLDSNEGVRSIAAIAVGKARLTGHNAALNAMLSDESDYARASAIFALASLGHDVDRGPLAGYLLEGDPPGLRGHAAFILGELGDPTAIPLLRSAAGAKMPRAGASERRLVELQISEAMVKLGDDDQLGPIRAALYPSQPGDLEAMALSIQILGEIRDRASRGRIVQISQMRDGRDEAMPAEVQLAIAITMAKLGDTNGWYLAEHYWESDREVIRADSAAVFGWTARDDGLPMLRKLMKDPSSRVRVAAAAAVLRSLSISEGSGRGTAT